jgi:hypothetical protein
MGPAPPTGSPLDLLRLAWSPVRFAWGRVQACVPQAFSRQQQQQQQQQNGVQAPGAHQQLYHQQGSRGHCTSAIELHGQQRQQQPAWQQGDGTHNGGSASSGQRCAPGSCAAAHGQAPAGDGMQWGPSPPPQQWQHTRSSVPADASGRGHWQQQQPPQQQQRARARRQQHGLLQWLFDGSSRAGSPQRRRQQQQHDRSL